MKDVHALVSAVHVERLGVKCEDTLHQCLKNSSNSSLYAMLNRDLATVHTALSNVELRALPAFVADNNLSLPWYFCVKPDAVKYGCSLPLTGFGCYFYVPWHTYIMFGSMLA